MVACALVLQHVTQGSNHLVIPAAGFKHGTAIEVADGFGEAMQIIRGAAGAAGDAAFKKCLGGQLTVRGKYTVRYKLVGELYVLLVSEDFRATVDLESTLSTVISVLCESVKAPAVTVEALVRCYAAAFLAVSEIMRRPAQRVACKNCLLYTSDAADEEDSGDLGGLRVI
eukprot:TRINITY_DN44296_c0_g1_i1.p1 TRINITY_DN44296_c0_g1~~TRINITY_DN44296_c0_g1_i1.p1  ORF type:complete len:170 (-),score=27.27 TRINITY_DN44296_c0_g1_i1:36-545(-)